MATAYPSPPVRRSNVASKRWVEHLLVLAMLLAAWEGICWFGGLPHFLVPSPSQIAAFAMGHGRELVGALAQTVAEAVATLIVSTVIGVSLALFFAAFRSAERLAFPYVVVLQAVPIVATAPLFIIWFGPDFRSIVAISVLMTLFPILSNMLTGLKGTDRHLLELFRVNRVSPWQTFWRLRLPAAIPYLGVGLRIASPLAVIGVIVGEYVAGLGSSGAGLGFLITQSALRLETAGVFAAGLVAALVGIAFWQAVGALIGLHLGTWHESERQETPLRASDEDRPRRLWPLWVLFAALLAGGVIWALSAKSRPDARAVTVALDWFPQPSNAAFYTARARGYYEKGGLDVSVQPGSAQAMAIQVVASGRAQFGLETAAHLLEARARGIPVVAIAATFQQSPAALFFHAGQPIRDFRDLNGRSVYTQVASPQWAWQKRHYGLDKVRDLQFQGSYAAFASDPRAVAQGYLTSTGDELAEQGLKTGHIRSREDVGYASVLFTTEAMIRDHPDIVRTFVRATSEGWADYRRNPGFTVQQLLPVVSGRTEASLLRESMRQQPFIWGGDAARSGWGWMTRDRWAATIAQSVAEGSIPPTEADQIFTTRFLAGQ